MTDRGKQQEEAEVKAAAWRRFGPVQNHEHHAYGSGGIATAESAANSRESGEQGSRARPE